MVEYTSGTSSWRKAVLRAGRGFSRIPGRRRSGWTLGVPLIAAIAGLLFTVSATTSQGTTLREDNSVRLDQLVGKKEVEVGAAVQDVNRLRADIDALTGTQAGGDGPVSAERARGEGYLADAGLTAVHGPGLTVRMDDAPPGGNGLSTGATQDDLVVHQQDVQAVVNALWAGGAEAMTIMGVRVVTTTAVLCVGNTLLLDGRRYSPEFVISAIGDPARMQASLDAAHGVQAFRDAVRAYGLGYSVTRETDIVAPAYQGSVLLRHASVPR